MGSSVTPALLLSDCDIPTDSRASHVSVLGLRIPGMPGTQNPAHQHCGDDGDDGGGKRDDFVIERPSD
jgi:hypothetical protein